MNIEDIDLTESEINLDEFSSIGSLHGGAKCGNCKEDGHNRRTCPLLHPNKTKVKKPKLKLKPRKKTTKSKATKTKATKTKATKTKKTSPASVEDLQNILLIIKKIILHLICNSRADSFLDLRGFKIPRGGLSISDFNYENGNYDLVNEFCKVKRFSGFSSTTTKKVPELDLYKFDLNNDDIYLLDDKPTRQKRPKNIKSFVYPLSSTKFIKGPPGGYGGLTSIDNDKELMKYVGALEKTNNIKRLVKNSKSDWRKLENTSPTDPLYYHFVILEGIRSAGPKAPVLGYIRLMRQSVLHDEIMLRIVIREEGRGIGRTSLHSAISQVYNKLKLIYSKSRCDKFVIVAETKVENIIGASAFTKWGFYKEDGGLHGVFKKPYGNVYRFTLGIKKALHILHPDFKTYKIPGLNKLKYLQKKEKKRYHLTYCFNGLIDSFKNEHAIRNALRNITNSLENNGIFVTITRDSINILRGIEGKSGSFGNDLYELSYSSIDTSKNFGIEYKMNKRKEYLLKNEVFKTLASEYDLVEIYTNNLLEFYTNTKEIPFFTEYYAGIKISPEIEEVLSLLRVSFFINERIFNITGLIPDSKEEKAEDMTGGSDEKMIVTGDKLSSMLRDITPRIYYTRGDDKRGICEGYIDKLLGDKVIIQDDDNGERFPLKITDFRYLNRDELKKWSRGTKNFRFVTNDIDLKMNGKRKNCVYLKNNDALWEMIKNIDSWKPFVFRNEPDERYVILYDKKPKAKHHFLIVPKNRTFYKELNHEDVKMLEAMRHMALAHIRNKFINTRFKIGFMNGGGNQSQLHLHVISNDIQMDYKSKFSKPNFINVNTFISNLKH